MTALDPAPTASLPAGTVAIGDSAILSPDQPLLALFCSARCPGALIIAAYDLARALRDAAVPVAGGFHTPVERDCLSLLLHGSQLVVVCPARSIARYRIPPAWKEPIAAGRLLVLSPFAPADRRPTRDLAAARNAFVAGVAARILVVHASPDGATHRLCQDLLAQQRPVLALDHPAYAHLLAAGARPFALADVPSIATDFEIPPRRSPPRPRSGEGAGG